MNQFAKSILIVSLLIAGSVMIMYRASDIDRMLSDIAQNIRDYPAPVFFAIGALGFFGIIASTWYGKWVDKQHLQRDKEIAKKLVETHAPTRVNQMLRRLSN